MSSPRSRTAAYTILPALTPSSQNVFCLAGTGPGAFRAKRPGKRSDQPHAAPQREPERVLDRGQRALRNSRQRGMSSPPPGSCASLCVAVFPGFSIRRLSLTFKTGSFPGEPVIGESPIGVSIVRGLGRRDTASDSCAVHFSFCYNQQRSSAPGCAARGAVTFLFV